MTDPDLMVKHLKAYADQLRGSTPGVRHTGADLIQEAAKVIDNLATHVSWLEAEIEYLTTE